MIVVARNNVTSKLRTICISQRCYSADMYASVCTMYITPSSSESIAKTKLKQAILCLPRDVMKTNGTKWHDPGRPNVHQDLPDSKVPAHVNIAFQVAQENQRSRRER